MKTMLFATAGLLLLAATSLPAFAADRYDGSDCTAAVVHTAPQTSKKGVVTPGKLCVKHGDAKG